MFFCHLKIVIYFRVSVSAFDATSFIISFVIVILRGRRMRPHMRRTAGSDDGAAKRPQNENGSYTDVAVYEPCIAKRVCRGVCVTP